MPVREFTDAEGRAWRAWEIRPEAIHPVTRAEDYLADCFVVGWIVFETVAATEKRRLCPYPKAWASSTEAQFREMLGRAELVPQRKATTKGELASGYLVPEDQVSSDKPDLSDLNVVRSFRYPGGRLWTVCVLTPEDGGGRALRFTSGMRNFDMRPWPHDWADAPNDELVQMLRRASPRRESSSARSDGPRRRWTDQPRGP